jgi:hypothetical protein
MPLYFPTSINPAFSGHPNIHDHHVRLQAADERYRLLATTSLADDLDPVGVFQQRPQTEANYFVIIN